MAITYVGAGAGDGTTMTIPAGHQNGDIILMFAFANSAVSITKPAPWNTLQSGSGGGTGFFGAFKIATSGAETSGTWTNATGLICAVLRGQSTSNNTPVLFAPNSGASTTSINYAVNALRGNYGTTWVIATAATTTTDSSIETAPAALTNVQDTTGASAEYVVHSSNGVYVGASVANEGTWPSTSVSVGGTAANYRSGVWAVLAEQGFNNNYKFAKAADNGNGVMSVTEKRR